MATGTRNITFRFFTPSSREISATAQQLQFPGAQPREVAVHEGGQYFSFEVDGTTLHGDSWALLSLLTGAHVDIATHEVLYIGMSFGKDGERNVTHRLRAHSTLQLIYEEHAAAGWDIFVTPLEIDGHSCTSMDHVDDSEDGFDFMSYREIFLQPSDIVPGRSKLGRVTVELVEHLLVSAFKPFYNKKLLNWDPKTPTEAMKVPQEIGFRLMLLALHGWDKLTRFTSASRPMMDRSGLLRAPLSSHPLPNPDGYDPYNAHNFMQNFHLRMADRISAADADPGILSVFGPAAPPIRRPPGVIF